MPRLDVRVPEPELMDTPAQAQAYSEADFAAPHQAFADEVARRFPELADGTTECTIVDLGCGPADITVRVARAFPNAAVVGIDAGPEMLRLGNGRVADAGLTGRVRLEQVHLPDDAFTSRRFDAVVSNSLLHHLRDPLDLWRTVAAVAAPGAPIAVMDLLRPASTDEARALVGREAGDEPEVLRDDFFHSLCAAYRSDEVRDQLLTTGLDHLTIETPTDRHLLISGRR